MRWQVTGPLIHWRGPAPFWFVALPPDACDWIDAEKYRLTYGWGVIPVTARIGATAFTTALFPRDGGYLLPVKVAVRRAEQIDDGDPVDVEVSVGE